MDSFLLNLIKLVVELELFTTFKRSYIKYIILVFGGINGLYYRYIYITIRFIIKFIQKLFNILYINITSGFIDAFKYNSSNNIFITFILICIFTKITTI